MNKGLVCCDPAVRKDVRVKKMYTGSMRITNQVFEDAYENSNSSEFKALAKQVTSQVRLLLRPSSPLPCRLQNVTFIHALLLPSLSAQNHLFQKSTAGQILRRFYSSGFQVSQRRQSMIRCFIRRVIILKLRLRLKLRDKPV